MGDIRREIYWRCPECRSGNTSPRGTLLFVCSGCNQTITTEEVRAQQPQGATLT